MIARNQLGEAYATTNLKLRKRRDDFRGVLGKKESKFFNRRKYIRLYNVRRSELQGVYGKG